MLIFIFLICLIPVGNFSYAQSSYNKLQIGFDGELISIDAQESDLKNVLSKVSKVTNIYVSYPLSLEKKITIKLSKKTPKEIFERILTGYNYALIYSGINKKQAAVTAVHIYSRASNARRASAEEIRIRNRIKANERRIESYRRKLSNIDPNSRRGKAFLRQIRNYEKKIDQLQRQFY